MKKNRRINVVMFLTVLIGLFSFANGKDVFAKTKTNKGLSFSYENVIPKNQISDKDYFELKVKPGDKQTLVTKVTNETNKKIIVQVKLSNATTSSAGIINYGPNKEEQVGKNIISITDIVDSPTQIKLKPKETKKIEFKLKVPKKEFDGIILGGIQLKELEEEKKDKSKEGASLKNEYSYIYSLSLRENDKKIKPEFTSSGAMYEQGAYVILNNEKPIIASKVNVETILMKKDSDAVLQDFKVVDYRFAPNSVLTLPLEGTEELPLGDYQTKTTVSMDDQKWEFSGKFKVTKKNQKKNDTFIDESPSEKRVNWLLIVILLVSFVGTITGIFLFLNRKKKSN